jgi:RecB family endonuclease NucS
VEEMRRNNRMTTHGSRPTVEDLITMKLLQNCPELANEYWTQVEVTDGGEIGRIDILSKHKAGGYIVVEIKSSADKIDEAIGQVLRYSYLLAKQRGYSSTNLQKWIVTPSCRPSHVQICKQLGIRLVVI